MPRPGMIRRFSPILTLLALTLVLNGCAGFATISESLFPISPEEEVQLGRKVSAQIDKDLVFVNDPRVVGYVRDLGRRIWNNSRRGPLVPRFYVVADKELNAFAIPGGNVYVDTGLIDAAEDEAELVSVIGHEVGHVVMRHGARNISRRQGIDQGINLAQQLIRGRDAGEAAKIVSGIVESGVMTNYSRQDEEEADTIAVETLYRMGYDPLAMRTFFARLKGASGERSNPVGKLFATHPPTAARMQHVSWLVGQLPPKPYARPVTDLRRAQGRLKQLGM